ncbi:PIN domain-containing protein [Spirosoma soli]|uniref:PIN domain-containing protein n=1 Tax=Spirosoma soli TaxID=1770529 RepID=A0ABW5M3X3_9BACT
MKIVVDTNVAFSAILNTNSKIGDLLFNSGELFTFYTCDYLQIELKRHKPKMLKVAKKMTEAQIDTTVSLVLGQITFINENLIDESVWIAAQEIVKDIDVNDTDFVALNDQLGALLWTGDKLLFSGLQEKGYTRVLNTDDLWTLRAHLRTS